MCIDDRDANVSFPIMVRICVPAKGLLLLIPTANCDPDTPNVSCDADVSPLCDTGIHVLRISVSSPVFVQYCTHVRRRRTYPGIPYSNSTSLKSRLSEPGGQEPQRRCHSGNEGRATTRYNCVLVFAMCSINLLRALREGTGRRVPRVKCLGMPLRIDTRTLGTYSDSA